MDAELVADTAQKPLARTPLHDLHRALGARLTPFAGYEMPVQYPSGVIAEHLHTRAAAGLFDVSHMGQALLEGAHALEDLEGLVPGDLIDLEPGFMRYTQLLDAEGGILDDLMATRLPDEAGRQRVYLVVNAGGKEADFALIDKALPACRLTRLDDLALLALQGPEAAAALAALLPGVERMTALPAAAAEDFAKALLADPRVKPAGLGARDSLRLEAGFCLCGHDIDASTDPVEAGLSWSIGKRRRLEGGFPGFARIARAIAHGPARKRVGLLLEGRQPAREGAAIETADGRPVGVVTSGGYAPSLGRPVAMGYVEAASAKAGAPLRLILRGKPAEARVVALPFVPYRYVRGA
ncbi:glycine cleavage T C-terminal barrel domain-containing protein [Methylocella sp.]|uniref:glycine cleavage T C-terminal barrel domain-containing protein n=1 Tax=Methylocella sp. TaxID=1978226 RepID=UPI003782E117